MGGFGKAFLAGLTRDSVVGTIPESVFATFQLTFAIITPALTVGAFAERMKFGALILFIALWFTFIYAPLAHMVWSGPGALLWDWGVLDFAGGAVAARPCRASRALVTALCDRASGHGLSTRSGDSSAQRAVRGLLIGARLPVGRLVRLQRGQRARRGRHAPAWPAPSSRYASRLPRPARCRGWLAGMGAHGKPSALGAHLGPVAGLVAITPASGFVRTVHARSSSASPPACVCFLHGHQGEEHVRL